MANFSLLMNKSWQAMILKNGKHWRRALSFEPWESKPNDFLLCYQSDQYIRKDLINHTSKKVIQPKIISCSIFNEIRAIEHILIKIHIDESRLISEGNLKTPKDRT